MTTQVFPADQAQRDAVLDTKKSFLVQAPAGSGKTDLLTRRFLKLLAEVNEPEEILAITFTKAATAEMRDRVMKALLKAHATAPTPEEDGMIALARAVLSNDAARDWHLLQQPQRLAILTIDAVCLTIAHEMPLLSRLGGSLSPTEKPQPLYDLAARRTLSRLGGNDELSEALNGLLKMRATSLPGCQALIAGMLDKRDQWGRVMPLMDPVDWRLVRELLEEPLKKLHEDSLKKAHSLFAQMPATASELFELIRYACGNLDPDQELQMLKDVAELGHLSSHDHWKGLNSFLFTQSGTYRKRPNKNNGFPAGRAGDQAKDRFERLVEDLQKNTAVLDLFCELRDLPPDRYSDEEFQTLRHLLLILRRAVVELRVAFAERRIVDFVELSLAARDVMSDSQGGAGELAAELAGRWRHLLVDEFQDTSRTQYGLLTMLAEGWESEDHGTCFLVGDPMQSIYGFRQAEVELFESTRRHGLGERNAALQLTPIQLQTNFRSHAALVNHLNDFFTSVFADKTNKDKSEYHVSFTPSVAHDEDPRSRRAVTVWPFLLPSTATPEQRRAVQDLEARRVVGIIDGLKTKVDDAEKRKAEYRIAVLVRAKSHLALIAQLLRKEKIPFRAVEIEQLNELQEVQDLTSLARALLHPMDRIAWLSVLRAPWCGLTLKDLHVLCGSDEKEFAKAPTITLLRDRIGLLSPDGQERARRVHAVLENALRGTHRQVSFARWVERTWATLGGDECVDATAYENVRAFLDLLEDVGPNTNELDARLMELCAQPDPRASERCGVQLMTIHKAKGLGFEVVIVPAMERQTKSDDQPLVTWLEQTRLVGPNEEVEQGLVVAPIGAARESSGIYKWIQKQQRKRQDAETKRLLYVAATRAREECHLSGIATIKTLKDGTQELGPGDKHSLLGIAWTALAPEFEKELEKQNNRAPNAPQQTEFLFRPTEQLTLLHRLPTAWKSSEAPEAPPVPAPETPELEIPMRGSLRTRAFGTVVHALLEDLCGVPVETAGQEVKGWRPRALALLRAEGLSQKDVESLAGDIIRALEKVLADPIGSWIIGPRSNARSEVAWSTWATSKGAGQMVRTLRGDRIFRAGAEPGEAGESHLWIVDYKTADHGQAGIEEFLQKEKEKYALQLETYGEVLKKLGGNDLPVRMALYFPLLNRIVYW